MKKTTTKTRLVKGKKVNVITAKYVVGMLNYGHSKMSNSIKNEIGEKLGKRNASALFKSLEALSTLEMN